MISAKTEALLRKLLAEQPTYKPNSAVLARLKHIDYTCFVGATCMGKTTLMDTLVALNPLSYGKTRNFTTRSPRADDDPKRYYYYPHTDEGLRPIFERIARHENLQHNINPYTLIMYGSEIDDYPHRYNLGDIFSSSIDGFRQLGFGTLRVFSVVTDPAVWIDRVEERFPVGNFDRKARFQEAIDSLSWSLAQAATNHSWIINPSDHIQVAAVSVDAAIRGEIVTTQADARALAEECLKHVKELLK
ncbi:hypothetical protein IPL85_03885 [Candidatus Saccharibacteria bacterium]|nr:MAG: hypothetical protein IPL85_03885 [Candidatus Saccharibacteria bacterium]